MVERDSLLKSKNLPQSSYLGVYSKLEDMYVCKQMRLGWPCTVWLCPVANSVFLVSAKPWISKRVQPAIPTVATARRHEAAESHRMVAEQQEAPKRRVACMAVNDHFMREMFLYTR